MIDTSIVLNNVKKHLDGMSRDERNKHLESLGFMKDDPAIRKRSSPRNIKPYKAAAALSKSKKKTVKKYGIAK